MKVNNYGDDYGTGVTMTGDTTVFCHAFRACGNGGAVVEVICSVGKQYMDLFVKFWRC